MSITNGFIKITSSYGTSTLPYPARGLNLLRQQFVDSARNANGQVVAQKINRRINKLEPLEWKWLTASQWREIQKHIDAFTGYLEFWDNPSGSFKTVQVYWGDESSEIHKINPATGEVLEYVNCKCNIIDTGYAMS